MKKRHKIFPNFWRPIWFSLLALCLTLQFFVFLAINGHTPVDIFYVKNTMKDFQLINSIGTDLRLYIYFLDMPNNSENLDELVQGKVVLSAVDAEPLLNDTKFVDALKIVGFKVVQFHEFDYFLNKKIVTGLFARRTYSFFFYIFYTKEGNTWWFGNILGKNTSYYVNKHKYLTPLSNMSFMSHQGLMNKFGTKLFHPFSNLLVPKNPSSVVQGLIDSKFLPCNHTRARIFHKLNKFDVSREAVRFRHRSWKLLSVVKTVFDNLTIPFWLSSGTCLGYFRECNIIPYSKDVDIGVFANDFKGEIIGNLEAQQVMLRLWLGELEDSLELSFLDNLYSKLDIFFYYKEESYYWNGGTQVKTGRKFKYIFPKFELCWTLFLELKVRVPCNTKQFIMSNYGPSWFTPQSHWDWKTSPFNVKENGAWPKDKLSSVIRQYG